MGGIQYSTGAISGLLDRLGRFYRGRRMKSPGPCRAQSVPCLGSCSASSGDHQDEAEHSVSLTCLIPTSYRQIKSEKWVAWRRERRIISRGCQQDPPARHTCVIWRQTLTASEQKDSHPTGRHEWKSVEGASHPATDSIVFPYERLKDLLKSICPGSRGGHIRPVQLEIVWCRPRDESERGGRSRISLATCIMAPRSR